MKNILFALVGLFIASQLFVSCSSDSNVLSQFSKRKYLKKTHDKNINHKNNIDQIDNSIEYSAASNNYASVELEVVDFTIKEITAIDKSTMIELKENQEEQVSLINVSTKDYSSWNNYNREMDFSNMKNFHTKEQKSIVKSKQHSEVLIGIFCFFIPFVGVLLYEEDVTTNFWITLVGTLLFWIPGIILAFLICFGDVSFN